MAALDKIINDMHADGTLTALSMKWFKADLTKTPSVVRRPVSRTGSIRRGADVAPLPVIEREVP